MPGRSERDPLPGDRRVRHRLVVRREQPLDVDERGRISGVSARVSTVIDLRLAAGSPSRSAGTGIQDARCRRSPARRTRRGAARRLAPDHPGPSPARRHARPSRRRARPLRETEPERQRFRVQGDEVRTGTPAQNQVAPTITRTSNTSWTVVPVDRSIPDRIAATSARLDPSKRRMISRSWGSRQLCAGSVISPRSPTRRTSMSPQVWAVYRRFSSAAAPYALAAATKTMMTTGPAHPPCVTALIAMRADPPIPRPGA